MDRGSSDMMGEGNSGSLGEEVGGGEKANKTESEKRADFRQMLIDNGVDLSWKWSQVADLAKKDMRCSAAPLEQW